MAKRLWEKGEDLNQRVHDFTVGDDPSVDLELVYWDLVGSAAHARMLQTIGLLTKEELTKLLPALRELAQSDADGTFEIPRALEDCHTAIESALVEKLDEIGRKIHTGRSRNDQVLLATRLYLRERVVAILELLEAVATPLMKRADELAAQLMPGYTHYQPAMPTTVGMWLHAYAEWTLAAIRQGVQLLDTIDSNPLGAASGFGVPLPLNRALVAEQLGFSRVQRNPIEVQNSRGRHELLVARWISDIGSIVEKFACDMVLYTTREFGFFSLPNSFTTGSSIMPQKHNPDVLELLRARAAKLRAAESELAWVTAKLPSHYHRDFQYTKEPVVRSIRNIAEMLPIVAEVTQSFRVNPDRLDSAMTVDLYATYDVYREVRSGVPFRDANRHTAERIAADALDKTTLIAEFDLIAAENGRERLEAHADLATYRAVIEAWRNRIDHAADAMLNSPA